MAKPKKIVDVSALIAEGNVASKKKSDIPDVIGLEKQADQVRTLQEAYKTAEKEFRGAKGELLIKVKTVYEKFASDGDFTKSMNLPGKETAGVQVRFSDSFSKIPLEQEAALKKELGSKYSQ